jgi:hypothetical protein
VKRHLAVATQAPSARRPVLVRPGLLRSQRPVTIEAHQEGHPLIESGKPDREERRVDAMASSIHRAYDHQPRDIVLNDAIGAALGIDPDNRPLVLEAWLADEMTATR